MGFPLYDCKFLILIGASFIVIFKSIVIYFCLPILISHVIRTQIFLSQQSGSYDMWRFNSVIDRIYLYNISNFDELLNEHQVNSNQQPHITTTRQPPVTMTPSQTAGSIGTTKRFVPKLEQIGPFAFRQDREKINIKFENSNATVVYDQKKSWTFLPELSLIKSLEELNSTQIFHMNIPLAGTTLNPQFAEFVEPVVLEFDIRLFLNHSVGVLLFDGYYDILMEQAKYQGEIEVDRFGWLNTQNNTLTRGVRVFTGASSSTMNKFGSIDTFNGTSHLSIWHYNRTKLDDTENVQCNSFKLASAGEFFPPSENSIMSYGHKQESEVSETKPIMNEQDKKYSSNNDNHQTQVTATKYINLFIPEMCRSFKLAYNGSLEYRGLTVDRYIANEFTFDYTSIQSTNQQQQPENPVNVMILNDNRCYCAYNENTELTSCPPNGMLDLFNCQKKSPVALSFPHFLYSNKDKTLAPFLSLFEDNVQPNETEHQLLIDLEPTLNVPVRAQVAMQFNVRFRNEPALHFTKEYSYLFGTGASNSQDFYLPQMWVKSSAEVDEDNLRNLKFIQKHLKLVTPVITLILFGVASILLSLAAKLAYDLTYGPKSRKVSGQTRNSNHQHESSNRNGTSYLDDKQKYFGLQLVADKSDSPYQGGSGGQNKSYQQYLPSTSSKLDDLKTECLPLNS